MGAFTDLLNHITKARVLFDNTSTTSRYEVLHPVFLDIDNCMWYIRNNENYTEYTLFLETLDAVLHSNG